MQNYTDISRLSQFRIQYIVLQQDAEKKLFGELLPKYLQRLEEMLQTARSGWFSKKGVSVTFPYNGIFLTILYIY